MKHFSSTFVFLFYFFMLSAQVPVEKIVKVIVAPNHEDWKYHVGEKATFSVTILQFGNPVKGAKIYYEIGKEKMEPWKKGTLLLAGGITILNSDALNEPGFVRCTVVANIDGKEYRGLATVGYDPEAIQPTVDNPKDFDQFWTTALTEATAIPMDTKMILLPERCTEKVAVYQVSLQHYRLGARLYGILCIPKKEGKYPAVLRLPGAGVRPYFGDIAGAEKGVITLEIGIHAIPVTMDQMVYDNLSSGALSGYMFSNLDDRNKFYYKRVFLGCIRANDFLTGLPQYDGKNLSVRGGSQGGALAVVTAALDKRVRYLISYATAMCDHTGYLKGRAGGWPHYLSPENIGSNGSKEKIANLPYYDVVNFARRLKVPGFYTWGFNDEATPPTSMFSAYNVITAPKELYLPLDVGHWRYAEQDEKMDNWLFTQLHIQ